MLELFLNPAYLAVGGALLSAPIIIHLINRMKFRRSGCFDVGIQCGGWGKVIVELSMKDKD